MGFALMMEGITFTSVKVYVVPLSRDDRYRTTGPEYGALGAARSRLSICIV